MEEKKELLLKYYKEIISIFNKHYENGIHEFLPKEIDVFREAKKGLEDSGDESEDVKEAIEKANYLELRMTEFKIYHVNFSTSPSEWEFPDEEEEEE